MEKQPPEVLCKKHVLKNLAIFTGKQLYWSLLLIKLQAFRPATLLKTILKQVFSCEMCKIFKSTYFEEYPRTTVSVQFQIFDTYLVLS